ncbi:MAG: matrixin family metalloprotease [Myxococcota bacterium]
MARIYALLVPALALVPNLAAAWQTKSTESGATVRWDAPIVRMTLSDSMRQNATAVQEAAAIWSAGSAAPVLSLSENRSVSPQTDDGINGVYIAEGWDHGDRVAVTLSTFGSGGIMVDADVLLNPVHFGPGGDGAYDVARTLGHEFGHVLGLGESEDPGSLMWPEIPRDALPTALSPDDEAGLSAVYGRGPNLALCGTSSGGSWAAAWLPVVFVLLVMSRPR